MAIVKRVSAPYTIASANSDPAIINLGDSSRTDALVTINGNLAVMGTETVFNTVTQNTDINEIVLNAGLKNSSIPNHLGAKITVNRGNQLPPASLFWNEQIPAWQLSDQNGNFGTISTQAVGNFISRVHDDPLPTLGGNLSVSDTTTTWTITSANNIILSPTAFTQMNTAMQLQNLSNPPLTSPTGYGMLFAGVPKSGKTGIYVTNSASTNEELITKRQAVLYSLIF